MKCQQCERETAVVKIRLIDENNMVQWVGQNCYEKTARETRVDILDDRDSERERYMQDRMMGGR